MFLLYYSERCNICELVLCECYVNDLYTTTCWSGVLGHRSYSMIAQEIKETATLFTSACFRHENRSSNGEAHQLARIIVDRENNKRVWYLQPPEGICISMNIAVNQ
jgi:hypothetical protein